MDSDQELRLNLLTECIRGYVETNHTTSLNHDASNLISFIGNHSERALLEACRNIRNKFDQGLVHVAAIAGHIQVLRALFVKLSDDDYLELLLVQDINDETPAIIASGLGNLEILTILMDGLSEQSCFRLLQLADGTYGTVVHHAALNNHSQVLDYVLGLVSKDLATELLLQANVMGIVPLHWAVLKGHIESTTSILDILGTLGHAILLQAEDKHGVSVMHYAVKNEEMKVTETILSKVSSDQRSQNLQKSDKSGNTNIHHAACNPNPEVMNCIIKSINQNEMFRLVQIANQDDQTPLHSAAAKCNVEVMRIIINSIVSHPQFTSLMQAEDDVNGTILHHASQCGSLHAVRCIVEALPEDVQRKLIKSTDAMGMTALHWAARSKQSSVFEFIQTHLPHDEWVELLAMKDGGGESVMHTAANSQCDRILEKILGTVTNADWEMLLNLEDAGGKKPDALVCSACKDNIFVFKATVDSQATIASVSSYALFCTRFYDGKSLLHMACCNGSVRVVEYILECLPPEKHSEVLQQQNHSGHTALHFAIESGTHELVKLFTKLVSEDNFMQLIKCNGKVGTPFHAAVRSNDVVIAKCVLNSVPVDMRIPMLSELDRAGQTPVHSAICNANADMLDCIVVYCTQYECMHLLSAGDINSNNVLQCALKSATDNDHAHDWRKPISNSSRKVSLEVIQRVMSIIPADERFSYLMKVDRKGRTSLHLAARYANPDVMAFLLGFIPANQHITAAELKDQEGQLLLHYACLNEDTNTGKVSLEVIQCILNIIPADQRFSYLMKANRRGDTCFRLAGKNTNPDVLEYLLGSIDSDQCIPAVTEQARDGLSLLHHACCHCDTEFMKSLLDTIPTGHRFDCLQKKDRCGNTSFHLAAKNTNTYNMEYLLQFISANQFITAVEQHDQDGRSMLHHACLKQDNKLLKSLLDRIPIDQQFNYLQKLDHKLQTPLHLAAFNVNPTMLSCLVRYCTPDECIQLLNAADISSNNVLQCALKVAIDDTVWWRNLSPNNSRKVSLEIIQYIMNVIPADQRFSYLMKVDRRGRTSFHLAARYADPDIMECLLGFINADLCIPAAELKDQEGQLLLHHACLNEDTKMTKTVLDTIPTEEHVRLLLIEDTHGVAAIHLAFFNGDTMNRFLETTLPAHYLVNLLQKPHWLTITNSFLYGRQFDMMGLLKVFELFPDDLHFVLLKLGADDGRTILHCLCEHSCLGQSTEEYISNCINYILQPLSSEQRLQLLPMKDKRDRICLHSLSSNNDISSQGHQDVMKLIYELVPADQRMQLLLAQDVSGMTILHLLCERKDYDEYIKGNIDCILQPLSSEQRIQLLLMKDESDRTCMHYLSAIKHISLQAFPDVMELIHELVPADQRMQLLLEQDESGMTILHLLCEHNVYDELEEEYIKENIDCILQPLSSEQRIQILLMKDKRDRTFLHCLSNSKDISPQVFLDVMKLIHELVPANQRIQLLHSQDENGMTFQHCLCEPNDYGKVEQDESGMTILHLLCEHNVYDELEEEYIKENIDCILQPLSSEQRIQVLLMKDESDRTCMHYLAGNKCISLQLILDLVSADRQIQLLLLQDERAMTVLHHLCSHRYPSFMVEENCKRIKDDIDYILLPLPAEHRIQLLSIQDEKDMTVLHYMAACMKGCLNLINIVLELVPVDKRTQLLLLQDESGMTVLHHLCSQSHILVSEEECTNIKGIIISLILQPLPADQSTPFLLKQDNRGRIALHCIADNINSNNMDSLDMMRPIMEHAPVEQHIQLFHLQDKEGRSILQYLFQKNSLNEATLPGAIKLIVESGWRATEKLKQFYSARMSADECIDLTILMAKAGFRDHHYLRLLLDTSRSDQTAFQYAIDNNQVDKIQSLLDCLGKEETFALLYATRFIGERNVLHQAAFFGYSSLLECLLRGLSQPQQLLMLRLKSNDGETAIEEAESWEMGKSVIILESYLTEARVSIALDTKHVPNKRRLLRSLIQDAPLTAQHVERLSADSSRFILPSNRKRAKCVGLILYNEEEREGAEAEASQIEDALLEVQCDVVRTEAWTDALKLNDMIISEVEKVLDSCVLLFVCIMSHGEPGMLRGSSGSRVPINDVLHQFNEHLPHHIPLVLLIQSCQLFSKASVASTSHSIRIDANRTSAPVDNKHIVLTRPNTALLLSTVSGGGAYRGVFTGAMSEQLCKADGKTDPHTLFNRAVHSMRQKQPEDEKQQPLFQSTMTKSLFLHSHLVVTRKRPGESDETAAKHSKTS